MIGEKGVGAVAYYLGPGLMPVQNGLCDAPGLSHGIGSLLGRAANAYS